MAILTNGTGKVMAFVGRWGPAFSASSVSEAHAELDALGAPREVEGTQLTVLERIAWLREKFMKMYRNG